jgi:hypothetical protein
LEEEGIYIFEEFKMGFDVRKEHSMVGDILSSK